MKSLFLLMLIIVFVNCNTSTNKTAAPGKYVVKNVSVIPMDSDKVLLQQDVFIADGVITYVGNAGTQEADKDALVIDGTGKYLIPGFAEMHAHVPGTDDTASAKKVLELYVLNGVTTIRGMLGHPQHLVLRDEIKNGSFIGPRFYAGAPGLSGGSVKSVKDADSLVRKYKKDGYDFLKLLPGLSLENFNVIAKTAKETGIPFAGHVSSDVGVWNAIAAGYASIDHLDGFVEAIVPGIEKIPEDKRGLFGLYIADKADLKLADTLLQSLQQNNIWVVPTQALAERWFTPAKSAEDFAKEPEMVYMDEKTLNGWVQSKKNIMAAPLYDSAKVMALIELRKKLIKACIDNNVAIVAGSDAPQVFDVPGFSLHQELKYMADAGLTPYQVLQTATANVGKYFNDPGMGVVKKGTVADLVLLSSNPLEDISHTTGIAGVFSGTHWLSKQAIDERLEQLKGKIKQ
ncbi:MAG: amidohydrolase family protein [Chitinophagaceae bacterium]|nr:amidohydrolase family protein [Chitinophagaceae bacterium]